MDKMSSSVLINEEENTMNTSLLFEENYNEECFLEENSNESNENRQYANPYLMRWLTSKQKNEKFRIKEYVEYSKDTNLTKCLIKSCVRLLFWRNSGNIKRHYRRMHNFVILHGKLNPFCSGEEDSSNLDKYFSYDCVTNKSCCKVPGCTKTFEGKNPEYMLHFRLDHNYKTDHNDWVNLCRLKFNRSKLPFSELVAYDKRASTYRCLFINCDWNLEKDFLAIEKHYHDVHAIVFSKHTGNARCGGGQQLSKENTEISEQEDFISDDDNSADESNSKPPTMTSKTQKRKKFFAKNYVEHCKETNVSKCLIRNCGRRLKGISTYNIQRHYQLLHNMYALKFLEYFTTLDAQSDALLKSKLGDFVSYNVSAASYQCLFMNCNDNLELDVNIIKMHYYDKHEIILHKKESKGVVHCRGRISDEEDENEPHCSRSVIRATTSTCILTNYVDLNKKCLMRNCPCLNEELEDEQTAKEHYRKVHNLYIGVNLLAPEEYELQCEYEYFKTNDFAYFDQGDSAYKCLFKQCNQVLENDLLNIKSHYHEMHMTVIGTCFERSFRKRKNYQCYESASSENDSFSVTNDICLVEDGKTLLRSEKKQRFSSELCTIKSECSNEIEEFLVAPISGESRATINHNYIKDITLTKKQFLKSCIGLIIEHDLQLHLFDDEVFFKHLLSPYEKIINFHINSQMLLDIIVKANHIIVEVLKETLCNKIICLEMYVVGQENKYFATVNVRSIHESSIHNYLIGFMPINKSGAEVLPIYEYLEKYNITKLQVYMTTILTDCSDQSEKMIEILNNICQHNPDIKKHPLHYIKLLYRSFVQKYSEEIKRWHKLLNNNDSEVNGDVFSHLNDLQRQLADSTKTEEDYIKETNLLLKSIKILRNFMEKLNEQQYVAGDFYRDLLCCELELKCECKKNNNTYAGKLTDDLMECKNILMQSDEFMSALYLDTRFNFLGSRLLTDDQKTSGKLLLGSLWERYSKYLRFDNTQTDPLGTNEDVERNSNDEEDEYALLNEHIKDMMPAKSTVNIEDLISNCVPAKREPFSLDILKYWHDKRQDMDDINFLARIAFTFPSSQYTSIYLKENFSTSHSDSDKIDKFLIKHNQNILDNNLDLLYQDL